MFPYQELAAPMMPQAEPQRCEIFTCGYNSCLRTCAWTCAIQSGHHPCYYSIFVTAPLQQVEAQDSASALKQLRESSELALAGVQAQERLLNDWKSRAAPEEGRKSGRK